MSVSLRVDGTWLGRVAPWGDLEVVHGRHGPERATWRLALRRNERPRCLRRNALVEIYSGGVLVWSGRLAQPDWDSLQFAAIGIARQGEQAECLTGSGALTSKPNTAIDAAIARGVLDWTRVSDFGNTDLAGVEGDATNDDPDPGKMNELLDLWADEQDSQWYVHPDGRLVDQPEDESNPTLSLLPGVGVLGVADDEVTDRVFLIYKDSGASGRRRVVSYPATTPVNGVERRATVVERAPMTSTRALQIATGMWRKTQAGRTGWTNGIEVLPGQIRTRGGLEQDLGLVRPGMTLRMRDTVDPRNDRHHLDFVIGETIWRPDHRGRGPLQINPAGMVARTFADVVADYRGQVA